MNKIISIIVVSILFSNILYEFELNNNYNSSEGNNDSNFPESNGIIDIESSIHGIVWVTTGNGLGRINYSADSYSPESINFSEVNDSNLPSGGNPALFVKDNIIIISGVEQKYEVGTSSYQPRGTGVGYSINDGESWNYMPQPICQDCTERYHDIVWGSQEITSLAVTTETNNVSYDLGLKDEYIYAASWAGGLRRFNYNNEDPMWEVIPLPMDDQEDLICNSINEEDYLLDPVLLDNHKGFSIFGADEYLWVGTANGINRGTITNGCIDWYHQTVANGLSGNWVVGIEQQITDDIDRIWAITWSAGSGEYNSISYTDNHGVSWEDVDYFTSKNIKIYNLDFDGSEIYVASEEGIFYSEDSIHWEKIEKSWSDIDTGDIILDETVYSVLYNKSDDLGDGSHILIGTGDGLVIRENGENNIYRFWNNHASSSSDNLGFSVYPNPFFTNEDGMLNGDGHVRFIYYNQNPNQYGNNHPNRARIDIYDFAMHHIITLERGININNEDIIIWDGRNNIGHKVVNGTYFCKLSNENNIYWTKLIIIN